MSSLHQPLSHTEKVVLQNLLARYKNTEEESESMSPTSFSLVGDENHGMTDASKRRMVEPPESHDSDRAYSVPLQDEIAAHTPKGKPICLPPGVTSVASWGRSIIQFGKFMSKKGSHEYTYKEVYDSEKEEDVRYVRWVKGQIDSASGHLLDLASYIVVRDFQKDPQGQLPVIPGTATARRVK